jgi:adenylate cyclase
MTKYWDFDVVVDELYENVNHVHPLKQKDVLEIVKTAKMDEQISCIIVFGSSVRFDCNSKSDIDIFVCRDDKIEKSPVNYDVVQSDIDVIYNFKCGDSLLTEIRNTGLIVYRR